MSSLSLYTIQDGLAELVASREELLAEIAHPSGPRTVDETQEKKDELAAVEKALAEYMVLEVAKVDNCHRFIAAACSTAAAARAEANALVERARRLESSVAYLKTKIGDVMAQFGLKRITGNAGRAIIRKGNGGVAPLVVDAWDGQTWTGESVLPDEYMLVTLRMPRKTYHAILAACVNQGMRLDLLECIVPLASTPDTRGLREALAQSCPTCKGKGETCADCGGEGKRRIAGARLGERGEHIELK